MGNCFGSLKTKPRRQANTQGVQIGHVPAVVTDGDDSVQSTRSERLETPQPPTDDPSQMGLPSGVQLATRVEAASGTGGQGTSNESPGLLGESSDPHVAPVSSAALESGTTAGQGGQGSGGGPGDDGAAVAVSGGD